MAKRVHMIQSKVEVEGDENTQEIFHSNLLY